MKSKESIVLKNLAQAGAQLVNDIASKTEDGDFLRDIIINKPHLYNKAQKLLASYAELVMGMSDIVALHGTCEISANREFDKWMNTLLKAKQVENNLYYECHFTDIGENH